MQITVSGHHVDLTQSLRTYVNQKMDKLERHFQQATNVDVILEVEKIRHKAEATIHVPGGKRSLHADSTQDNMYAAIDLMIDKLDRQIIKHKEKLTDHHRDEKRVF